MLSALTAADKGLSVVPVHLVCMHNRQVILHTYGSELLHGVTQQTGCCSISSFVLRHGMGELQQHNHIASAVQETCIQYGFPPHEVFSSQDIEAKVPLLAVLCKCSIVYGRNGPTGNHNYLCPFAYDYASNSLRGH